MSAGVLEKPKPKESSIWAGMDIPVIGLTGDKGSGKTVWASSIDPENTLMIDLELSSQTYNFPYKTRYNLYDEVSRQVTTRQPTPLDCYLWFQSLIESIKPGEYSVVALDPASDIESGLTLFVQQNPELFGHTKGQYERASGIMWGDLQSKWKLMLGLLASKVKTFVFTTHLGSVWGTDGRPLPGQTKPKGKSVLMELASLYLHLERKPVASGADVGKIPAKPIARVLKSRLMVTEFVNGEMQMWPVLPGSFKDSTPKKVCDYIRNPVGKREITDDERAAPAVNLTDDEKLLMKSQIVGEQLEIEKMKSGRLELAQNAARVMQNRAASVAASVPASVTATTSTPSAGLEAAKKAVASKPKAEKPKTAESAETPKASEPAKAETPVEAAKTEATETPKQVETAPESVKPEVESSVAISAVPDAPVADTTPGVTSTIWQVCHRQLELLKASDPKWTDAMIKASLEKQFQVSIVDGLRKDQAEVLSAKLRVPLEKLGLNPEGFAAKN